MIVYGERRRTLPVRRALRELEAARAGDPVSWLIAAGELACGLLDRARERSGCDDAGELEDACHELVLATALAIAPALSTAPAGERGAAPPRPEADPAGREAAARARLGALDLPAEVEVNAALEGFSHYAVDPDQFARAARYARASIPPPRVVMGIRSIGLPLAAVVAAALPGAALVSARPSGHPFRREVRIGDRLRERLVGAAGGAPSRPAGGDTTFAVVDEGPGLSGSSFAAVAEWLAAAGVPPERTCYFPSHGGEPGPEATDVVRRRWRAARRHVVEPDLRPLTDGADAVDELAGGRWRARLRLDPATWPPASGPLERRKLIVERGGGAWLYKFAGLGRLGPLKAERARRLAAAGLHPPVGALVRGYLACEWFDDARPIVSLDEAAVPRAELVAQVGAVLLARAGMPASDGGPGASPHELVEMARHNTGEALGAEAARAIDRIAEAAPAAARAACPVGVDGRLHRWEWIARPGGALYKVDAVDHALGHDLVGEQDRCWDLAGAAIELELDDDELEEVRRRIGRPAAPPAVEELYRVCYAAFQLGAAAMTESLARAGGAAEEADRLAAERGRYRRHLERLVLAG